MLLAERGTEKQQNLPVFGNYTVFQCAVHQQQVVVLTTHKTFLKLFGALHCVSSLPAFQTTGAVLPVLLCLVFIFDFLKILGYRKNAKYHFVANAYHMMAMLALHYYIPEAYSNQTTAALQ